MMNSKFWIRLTAVLCALALLLPLMGTACASSYPYEAISIESVNLRAKASTSSALLKKISAGETITILGVSGSFYKVEYAGKTGYCQKQYVDGTSATPDAAVNEAVKDAQTPPAITSYPYDTIAISNVKLRKSADSHATVYVLIPAGGLVTVISAPANGFVKVKYNGKTGYAAATHINLAEISDGSTTSETASSRYTLLVSGNSGSAVTSLQTALAELGYLSSSDIDGKYGAKTVSAVKTFQKRNGLTQSGEATTAMQELLYEGTPKDYRGYRQYVTTVASVDCPMIRAGGSGDAVTKLQVRLVELGYYDNEISGTFDELTIAAFKMFEGTNGLNADGIASPEDQEVLYSNYVTAAQNKTETTEEYVPFTVTLRKGNSGSNVKILQTRLTELGYYAGSISGKFDDATVSALKAFQTKSNLTADGICGPVTRTVLFGSSALRSDGTRASEEAATEDTLTPETTITIRAGSSGENVLKLQTRLQELGYYTSRLDGLYLTEDINAVRAFQKANSLTVDGTAGYQTQVVLYSDAAIAYTAKESTEDTTTTTTTLRYGDESDSVKELQTKLISLGYLSGTADGKYGVNTKKAVSAFQKANGLKADGIAGAATQAALSTAKAATTTTSTTLSTSETLKEGSVSESVKILQNRLIELGYLSGKADGVFGTKTSLALIAFQKANALTADGIAGKKTINKLNSTTAKSADSDSSDSTTTVASAPVVNGSTISASMVRYANWYTEVKAKCKLLPNVTVYDYTTGISWSLNIFSLGAHADAEPLTAEDTANMNRAFGGETTWTPKAVWVVFSDGTVYIATTHNHYHGVQHNTSNNFPGHLCIHFPRTQAQVEKIGPYATSHQKAVELGWAATQKMAGN